MATGGHAPEIDVLINLQQVRQTSRCFLNVIVHVEDVKHDFRKHLATQSQNKTRHDFGFCSHDASNVLPERRQSTSSSFSLIRSSSVIFWGDSVASRPSSPGALSGTILVKKATAFSLIRAALIRPQSSTEQLSD